MTGTRDTKEAGLLTKSSTASRARRIISSAFAAALIALAAAPAHAQPQADARLKDEAGLLRIKAVYPVPGSTISGGAPMITADASGLESPLDPQTVTITLNGADVTADAEIMPTYIMYTPPAALPRGNYEVRIIAANIAKQEIEPLAWTFTSGQAQGVTSQGATGPGQPAETAFHAQLSISRDSVKADYVRRAVPDVSVLFREKEGDKINADFTFSSVNTGRAILGAYHRETQDYTGVVLDKGRISYSDDNFTASLGNFWFSLSDLTVMGAELAGAALDRRHKEWGLTLFSGRTQDPSTSGSFKQITTGFRTSYDWNPSNKTYLTVLSANETDDPYYSLSGTPARDSIIGVYHEFHNARDLKSTFEISKNTRTKKAQDPVHDSAWRVTATKQVNEKLDTTVELYNIGSKFLPIAEGSSRYLKNDRKGYKGRAKYAFSGRLIAGGETEHYSIFTTNRSTQRDSVYLTGIAGGNLKSVTLNRSRLTSNGSSSRTDGGSFSMAFKPSRLIGETRVNGGWQKINYTSLAASTKTVIKTASLSSAFKNIFNLNAGYSVSNTSDLRALTAVENKNLSLGVDWNAIPFKLLVSGRYETAENQGSNVSNKEKRLKTSLKYITSKAYAVSLGLDNIRYWDAVSPFYDYSQKIVRTGVEREF